MPLHSKAWLPKGLPAVPHGVHKHRKLSMQRLRSAVYGMGSPGSSGYTAEAGSFKKTVENCFETMKKKNARITALNKKRRVPIALIEMPTCDELKRAIVDSLVKVLWDETKLHLAFTCPDCPTELELFQSGEGKSNPNPRKAVADRYNEYKGYTVYNICWRDHTCNSTHEPKINGDRTCDCGCEQTFKAVEFAIAAFRGRGVCGV